MPAWSRPDDGPWPTDWRRLRWGLYLRPDPITCRDQAMVHDLVERQFGLRGGGTFMPHCTVKGFFLSATPQDGIVAALDPVMAAARPFPVHNGGPVRFGPRTNVLDVQRTPDGGNNDALTGFHTSVFDALAPLVHPECDFTPRESARDRFHGHLTLTMADCPDFLGDEVADFISGLGPIGSPGFDARHLHLFALTSQDWAGAWWETLRWRLTHAWTLA
jgi:hypothetical protein